jgi:hypothetical protein
MTKEKVEIKDNQNKKNKDKQFQLNNKIKMPQKHKPNKRKKMLQKEKVAEEDQDKVKNDLIFLNKLHIHQINKRMKKTHIINLCQTISITRLPTYSLFLFIDKRFF